MHPFVKRAVDKAKLGMPKPIWYDTIVNRYPPIIYDAQGFQSKLRREPIMSKTANAPPTAATENKNDFSSSLKKRIEYPEDIARQSFYLANSFIPLRNPISLSESASGHSQTSPYTTPEIELVISTAHEFMQNETLSFTEAIGKAKGIVEDKFTSMEIEQNLAAEQALFFKQVKLR